MRLFCDSDAPRLKASKLDSIRDEIRGYTAEYANNVDETQLSNHFIAKLKVTVPIAHFDKAEMDESTGRLWTTDGFGERKEIIGTLVNVDIPFDGDAEVFSMCPSSWDSMPPEARIVGSSLRYEFGGEEIAPARLSKLIDERNKSITQYLTWHRELWGDLDEAIGQVVRIELSKRRDIAKRSRENAATAAAALGIKLRERPGDPATFVPPQVRQKVVTKLPSASATRKDPSLDRQSYEAILKVIRDAGRTIERSQSALRDHDEEVLRDVLLLPLNSHFSDSAVGEAFNRGGKTDILIRHEGANLFIAECKVWKGDQAHTDAIDQLFGYLTWQDTKTAIIVFNRNKNFSSMRARVQQVTKDHPCCVAGPIEIDERTWEYRFHREGDANDQFAVTVVAVDLGPKSSDA